MLLHLLDAASPQACPATLALMGESLGRLAPIEQRVLLLGGRTLRHAARDTGINEATVQHVPWGMAVHALPMMSRLLRGLPNVKLIHCWSIGTLALATLRLPRTPRVLTLTTIPSDRSLRFLRAVLSVAPGSTVILTTSATIRRELLSAGIDPEHVAVLRPALDMGKVAPQTRLSLREGWGVGEEAAVVALLSDPPHAGDAVDALWATGLANMSTALSGKPLHVLITPDQRRRARALKLAGETKQPSLLILEPRLAQPWNVLPGCDAALAIGPESGGLSLLWAMAAGIPILGEARYAVSEIVEDRHSALLAKPGDLKTLAHRLEQILTDRQLAWKLRDTARHEAYSFFSRVRYCQSLKQVYEQVQAGRPVEVPPLEVTGGLRFAGRG